MDIQIIVKALIADGMTQSQIAAVVGCSQPTISDIANGHAGKKRPSYHVVTVINRLAVERNLDISP